MLICLSSTRVFYRFSLIENMLESVQFVLSLWIWSIWSCTAPVADICRCFFFEASSIFRPSALFYVIFHHPRIVNNIVSNTDAYVPYIPIVWFPLSEVILLSWCNWCRFVSNMDFFRPFWAQFSWHQFCSTVFARGRHVVN